MDRRDFLEKGGLFGAAGLASAASGTIDPALEHWKGLGAMARISPPDMDEYLAQIDAGMEQLANLPLDDRFPGRSPEAEARRDLVRKALRTLYLTGMVGDLTVEAQTHSGIQKRLWDTAPEIDDTILSMTEYLSGLTVTEKADLQKVLRHKDNPAMQISEGLTDAGALLGMSTHRRIQTRAMVTQISWRLRNQPPDLVIGEYLEKVEKLKDSPAREIRDERRIASLLGEKMFWKTHEMQADSEKREMPWGLKVMGKGLIVFAAGALLVAIETDATVAIGLITGTVGAVMILVGLVALLIHAIKQA